MFSTTFIMHSFAFSFTHTCECAHSLTCWFIHTQKSHFNTTNIHSSSLNICTHTPSLIGSLSESLNNPLNNSLNNPLLVHWMCSHRPHSVCSPSGSCPRTSPRSRRCSARRWGWGRDEREEEDLRKRERERRGIFEDGGRWEKKENDKWCMGNEQHFFVWGGVRILGN